MMQACGFRYICIMFSTCISALRNSGDERIWREITPSVFAMVFLVQLFSGVSLVFLNRMLF